MKSMFVKMVAANLILSAGAFASVTNDVGVWKGDGSAFNLSGKKVGSFGLQVTTTSVSEKEVSTEIAVTLPDGSVEKHHQQMVDSKEGFSIKSDQGDGGGYCLTKGLCQAYIQSGKRAYSIVIVMDGADARRMLVTTLEDGKATGQISERLVRQD